MNNCIISWNEQKVLPIAPFSSDWKGKLIKCASENSSPESHDVRESCMEVHCKFVVILLSKIICKVDFLCKFPLQELGIFGTNVVAQNATYKVHVLHDGELADI